MTDTNLPTSERGKDVAAIRAELAALHAGLASLAISHPHHGVHLQRVIEIEADMEWLLAEHERKDAEIADLQSARDTLDADLGAAINDLAEKEEEIARLRAGESRYSGILRREFGVGGQTATPEPTLSEEEQAAIERVRYCVENRTAIMSFEAAPVLAALDRLSASHSSSPTASRSSSDTGAEGTAAANDLAEREQAPCTRLDDEGAQLRAGQFWDDDLKVDTRTLNRNSR